MEYQHTTVLLNESVEGLRVKPNGIYVDGTLGGGGHSRKILKHLGPEGRLIGIDQDPTALENARSQLKEYKNFQVAHSNFSKIRDVLEDCDISGIDGLLLDLGVSSHQLDTPERGFSYMHDGELDMRMDPTSELTARVVVNSYKEKELNRIIKEYGEENWAKRIAKFIVEERKKSEIMTSHDLVEVIKKAIPAKAREKGPHPAKRTFQAIRIEVNNELGVIKDTIHEAMDVLNPKGRIAIITFHSLEDRIVKNTFKELASSCVCPPELPVCTCGKESEGTIITRKPILPSKEEIEINPRSRSAKLRIFEKAR